MMASSLLAEKICTSCLVHARFSLPRVFLTQPGAFRGQPFRSKTKAHSPSASSQMPAAEPGAPLKPADPSAVSPPVVRRSHKKGKGSSSRLVEFPPQHQEIIKVLHKRRHHLKAHIQLLREKEIAQKKSRPLKLYIHPVSSKTHLLGKVPEPVPARPQEVVSASLVPLGLDRRLDPLSSLHVGDVEHLDQDHLSNMSDFRVQQRENFVPPRESGKTITRKESSADVTRRKQEQADKALAEVSRKKVEEREKNASEKLQLDMASREQNLVKLSSSLKSFLLACVHADMHQQAIGTFAFYRERYTAAADRAKLLDVHTYNLLLSIHAKKGRMDRVKETFAWMKSDSVHPDTRSFALALETLGRHTLYDAKTARRIAHQMHAEKIQFDDIFAKCSFVLDEKEKILSVVEKLEPGFEPRPLDYRVPYHPSILRALNRRPTSVLADTPYRGLNQYEERRTLLDQQLEREAHGSFTVQSVDAPLEITDKLTSSRLRWESQKADWRDLLAKCVDRSMEQLKNQVGRRKGINIYPYLCTLESTHLVDLLVEEVVRLAQMSEGYSPTTLLLDLQLGGKVMDKYLVNCKVNYQILDRVKMVYGEYLKYFDDLEQVSLYNCREKWQKIESELGLPLSPVLADHLWPKAVTARIGKFLYDIIISEIKVDTNCMRSKPTNPQCAPAVYKVYRHYGDSLKEELKPHPILVRLYKAASPETLTFPAVMCPTVVPPLPWTTANSGGYLLQNTILTRLPDGTGSQNDVVNKVPSKQIYPVLDSLNQLGASPWIINRPMLDLAVSIFRNKGMPDVDIPPPVSECPPLPKITQEMGQEEKAAAYRQRYKLKQQKNEMFSLWCDALYKLSIANHFRDSIFYFPHNIDFRGRVYPVPPHFHHLGGDMTRSILLFAKGMPLGESGLDWLKIHLVNLTGLKKKSPITERLAYANEIIDDILDSAGNPLTGRMWWKKSDDPWQTLACCREIAAAMRSPDSAKFISHFPIHQDGSCNGLQHYAALGRDQKGAESVNLAPFDTPQDVYSGVAALVEEERKRDATDGLAVAKALEGFVGRKVVKQTVMTIVYGVTKYGAKAQIHGQLTDLKEFDQDKVWPAAAYLAGKTFDSIKQMFTATRQIQEWFVECARLISTVREKPVEWVTPLGLPVMQPYFKANKGLIGRATLHLATQTGKVNTMKQKNAFPPNFIHSLDSTHMMLTCLQSARAGISFVSVHDSYWTHPMTVEIMNKICREQFVALHNLPILDDLSKQLVKKFALESSDVVTLPKDSPPVVLNKVLTDVPRKGNFDLKSVLRSVYFFS